MLTREGVKETLGLFVHPDTDLAHAEQCYQQLLDTYADLRQQLEGARQHYGALLAELRQQLEQVSSGHHRACAAYGYTDSEGVPHPPICHPDCFIQRAEIAESQVDQLRQRVDELEAHNTALKQVVPRELVDLRAKLAQVTTTLNTQADDLYKAREACREQRVQLAQVEGERDVLLIIVRDNRMNRMTDLQHKLADAQATISELQQANSLVVNLQRECREAQARIRELEAR